MLASRNRSYFEIGRWACLLACGALAASHSVALAADEADEELVQMVAGLLGEKDKDLRSVALEQVRTEAKGAIATRRFAAQLPKLSPDAQAALLSALADRQDVAAKPAVLELLASEPAEGAVRVAAIKALGTLGGTPELPVLLPLVGSSSKAEQEAARASLTRLRGDATAAGIAEQVGQGASEVRVALIGILASRRAIETIPTLLKAAVDADPTVRAAAMGALGQIGGPEQIPAMVQGVLAADKGAERDAAEKAVAQVCNRIAAADQRAPLLISALNCLETAQRQALLPTLGRVGGSAALPDVEAALADSNPQVHDLGLRAIANWPETSIAPRLIELAQQDTHPEHRALLLAALIRVAPLPDKRTSEEKLALVQKVLALCSHDSQRNQLLKRASAIRDVATLRFILPYLDEPPFAQTACETIVELAHHRPVREPNKAEFLPALDRVIHISKDPAVVERAERYKVGKTWAKPTPGTPQN